MKRGLWVAVAGLSMLFVVAPARGADEETIQRAVDRGVAYLKGAPLDGNPEIGATALVALTLLECGVPVNDPKIQKAATAVREAAINLTKTYSISLSIMFLDRLGEPVDVALIESLTIRLLAGQDPQTGGWSYECPTISQDEAARLRQALSQRNELVGTREPPKPGEGPRRDFKDLPREIQQQWNAVNAGAGAGVPGALASTGDNSNTQFGTLGLWVGRRQGIPVEKGLARVEARFRGGQRPDGGWTYTPQPVNMPPLAAAMMPGMNSTPPMTCAGLIGLAAGYGIGTETALRTAAGPNFDPAKVIRNLPDPANDPHIKAALKLLASFIDNPNLLNQGGGRPGQPPAPVPGGPGNPQIAGNFAKPPGDHPFKNMHYFLWSLERVAVAYSLDTIENKDWYRWGSDILLGQQAGDGSWSGDANGIPVADTCFALLFLKRANLASDLSAHIRNRRSALRGGAGSGADLLKEIKENPGLKPGPSKDDRTTEAKPSAPEVKPSGVKPQPEVAPPSKASDPDAGRLSDELVNAPPAKQDQVLEKLRDSKGGVYSAALADAIPRLAGAVKNKAREALAERFTRMTANTLKDKLDDNEPEVRRAAVLACGMKEDKTFIPRLIDLLQDKEPAVMRAAHAALKSLTSEDFGPAAESSPADLKKAVDAWKAWLARTSGGK
jgi:hypothetical protein